MSDLILLGALRAPMPGYPCPTMTLRQLVERAREAADRIEADAAKLEGLRAEVEALKAKIASAYGYLWLVNNDPDAPHQYPPERAAYEARKCLRDTLTKEQRGEGINAALLAVRAAIDAAKGGGNG